MKQNIRKAALVSLVAGAATLLTGSVVADSSVKARYRANHVQHQHEESIEHITSVDQLKKVGLENLAPTEIWRRLEHGEKVECLSCIPEISKLIYADNAKTREIAAWWLRRRVFGVFGPGQAYQQTLGTLSDMTQSEKRRAHAAEALGEFLHSSGIAPVATAATKDPSPMVRRSAVAALERLNSQGPNGELGAAIEDDDVEVRMAALRGAVRVHVFTDVPSVVTRISDDSPRVRKRAAEVLGAMKAKDAVAGLVALTSPDAESDPEVRASAVWALGQIADVAGKDAVYAALKDPYPFVRDAAKIATRRL